MSNIVIRYQGDDIPLLISMNDSSGIPINITNLAELYVFVLINKTNQILAQFSKTGGGGFQSLVMITNFIYRADIFSGTTKDAAIGLYDIDVNVVQTDADYEASQKNTIGIKGVFQLNKSVSKIKSSG
jgi:hypothetical protein